MTKVDIFSGFLGAGKTTLIKKLIAEGYENKDIVLIENEFGEIGVDTGFLRDTGIQINEMVAGCICCTLVGDFGKALDEVVEKYNPSRILIEPSGVGKLSDVIIAVQDLKNDKIELNGFTTVVDAKRFDTYMKNFGEFFQNQVENASSIFLSHQQDMTSEEINKVADEIRALNPNATIITTDWDQISGKRILEVMEEKKTLNAELDKLREEAYEELEAHEHHHHHHHHDHDDDDEHECGCGHHHHHDEDEEGEEHEHCHHHHHHDDDDDEHEEHDHDHECGCGHHHHHHHGHDADEVFDEVGVHTANKYSKAELEEIVDSLDECGEVLRAKGIVENEAGGWLEFDYVPGEGEVRETEAEATGMVVVIGTSLKKDKINELFRLA